MDSGWQGGGVDGLGEVDKVTISSLVLFKMPKIRRVGVGGGKGGEVLFIDLGLIEKFHFRFVGVLPAGGDRDVGVL